MGAHPAIQVVTLTDALFSKKTGKMTSKTGYEYRSRFKKSTSSLSSPAPPSSTSRSCTSLAGRVIYLKKNNRIPMKTSPYLGYLRHAPSRKSSPSYYPKKNFRLRSFSLDGCTINSGTNSTNGINKPFSESFLFETSSPYVGFMRHAPPSYLNVRSNNNKEKIRLMKKYNNENNKNGHYCNFSSHQEYNHKDDESSCSSTTTSTTCASADDLLLLRYPEHSQFISGRLPGGNPLQSYYSMCQWFTETEGQTEKSPYSNSHNHYHRHHQDLNPAASFEMFHKIASWFLFPIAYDERTSFVFSDMGDEAYMDHVKRGFAFFSSFVKQMIPGRDALFICTGGVQMDGNSLIPLPLSVSVPAPVPTPAPVSTPLNESSSTLPNTILDSNHDLGEEEGIMNDASCKTIDSSSLPSNHPLQVSVSSLAKAYHTEQLLSVYSSEDIAAMSSEEIQRHLDIESILRLPTITYQSSKEEKEDESEIESGEEICQAEGNVTVTSIMQENTNNENLSNEIQNQHCHETAQTNNNALEWSWIAVPQDPSKINNVRDQQEADEKDDSKIKQADSHVGEIKDANQNQDEHCVICLEQFEDGDRLRVLPCGHQFHTGCIDKWLSGSSSYEECFTSLCPTCKKTPNVGVLSNSPSFEVGEDDSMGTMGEEMRVEGIVPSWAFARLGGSIANEK
jgi:hypothetical protein